MKSTIDLFGQTMVSLINHLLPSRPSRDLRIFIAGFVLGHIFAVANVFLFLEGTRTFLEVLTKIH